MKNITQKVSAGIILLQISILSIIQFDVMAQEARPLTVVPTNLDLERTISVEESEERLNDAMMLFKRGKTAAAIYMLQQLQKADPTNYKVLFKLGEMAIAARNWAYSITVLRKASLIRPEDIEVRLILMDIYKAYQMPIQSVIVAREILALDPGHQDGIKRLADLFQEQSMLEDEIETRKIVQSLLPRDYDNLKRMADVYNGTGKLAKAADMFEYIREYYPKNDDDLSKLAGIYDRLGESAQVLDIIDELALNGISRDWLKNRLFGGVLIPRAVLPCVDKVLRVLCCRDLDQQYAEIGRAHV